MADAMLDRLTARLGAADASLDDLARARLEAQLERALDDAPVGEAAPVRSRRGLWLAGLAVATLVLAVGVPLAVRGIDRPPVTAAVRPPVRVEIGDGEEVATRVAAGATITARGPCVLTIVESGGRAVVRADHAAIRAEIDGPLVHLDAGGGLVLDVHAAVFALDATVTPRRLIVERGLVEVELSGRRTVVSAGETWTDAPPAAVLPPPAPTPPPALRPRGQTPARPAASPAADRPDDRGAPALYDEADRALARGDRAAARVALRTLVDRYPTDRLADDARYQLARFAIGDPDAALAYLAAIRDPALDEPVAYLRCRILVTARDAGAADCLEAFRRDHPSSPHDDDALLRLADLRFAAGDCAAARPLLEAYLSRHPDAEAARDRLARCAP